MRSIFWIGCILAVLVSLLSAGAFAESAGSSTVGAALSQAANVTDAAKDAAVTTGTVAAQAANVTDAAKDAAAKAGISGAENVTDAVKQVATTVGTAAKKAENITDTAKEVLASVGAEKSSAANETAPAAESNVTKVTETAAAEPDLVNDTLVKFVTDARTYALNSGKAAALEAFKNPVGGFVNDKMYIFAYDYDGDALCLPYNPGMVGVNQIAQADSTGFRYIQQMRDTAKKGVGFVTYQDANMMNKGAISKKISYVTDVDGTYWIGAGVYQADEKKPVVAVAAVKDLANAATEANTTAMAENLTAGAKNVSTSTL